MAQPSTRACPEGIEKAKQALVEKGLSQKDLADVLNEKLPDDPSINIDSISDKTINAFFRGTPVKNAYFNAICKYLGLDRNEIAGIRQPSNQVPEPSAPIKEPLTKTTNIDELVRTARDNIRDYINERCGTMRVLGMARPMGLDDIYTSVNILEKITKSKYSSPQELLQHASYENFDRISLGRVCSERVPGLSAFRDYSKLMILGKPGAGKTTFLKYIALQCINGNFEPSRIPLFITLKDFAEADGQPLLLEYLTQTFTNVFKDLQVIEQLIEQGKLIILFDGLDEVKEADNKRIVKDIKNFTIKYNKNQFIITCRIAAREYIFEQFTDVEITDFDSQQIETFVDKWFTAKNNKSIAEEFIWKLKIKKPIKELANIPILLTLLCLVFEQKGTFPPNPAKLYEDGLDALLDKWDTTRGIERDQLPYKNLSLKQRKDLLSQIAYPTFKGNKYFFEPEDVEEYITQYYNLLNIKNDIDTKEILQSISAQHGLLIERARGIYSFSHLTFHEYFTARKIKEARNEELLRELCTHIIKTRWQEVFLLTAGLMDDKAGQLLNLMERQVRYYINTDKLQALLRWADKETAGSVGDIKPVGKRAFAISNAYAIAYAYAIAIADINANAIAYTDANAYANTYANAYANAYADISTYAYAIAIANAIAYAYAIANTNAINQFIDYTRDLEKLKIFNNIDYTALTDQMEALKSKIPNNEQPKSMHKLFIKDLIETWFRAFGITPEILNLSTKEIETLNNYLDANSLIIECKKAAVKVAPETWQKIEDRMFTID